MRETLWCKNVFGKVFSLFLVFLFVINFSSCVRKRTVRNDYSYYSQDSRRYENDTQQNYKDAYNDMKDNSFLEVLDGGNASQKGGQQDGTIKALKRLPWEVWEYYRDLNGNIIVNTVIESADDLSKEGNYRQALEMYQRARIENLSIEEQNALTARIAGAYLALDEPQKALETISSYAGKNGQAENLNQIFSLILGFAYGRTYNYDQSLAWFLKVIKNDTSYSLSNVSSNAIKMLLMSASDSELNSLYNTWQKDSFVVSLIRQENEDRQRTYKRKFTHDVDPFWSQQITSTEGAQNQNQNINVPYDKNKKVIAVLLPLSGRYQKLGENTKKGIELATSKFVDENNYTVNFFDTKGDALYSTTLVREILENQNVVMFLGPLLSEVSEKVSEVVESEDIPMLTFSKNNNFMTRYGIFRLGITPSSEVSSLINALYNVKKARRFAVLYPQNEKGRLYANSFMEEIENWPGANIVFQESYIPNGKTSFLTIASSLEKSGADVVFMPDDLREVAKLKYSLSNEYKDKVIIAGPSSWDSQEKLISQSAALDGIIFTSPFYDKSQKELVQKFNEIYLVKYREKPDFLAAQGFDAIAMIFASIKRAANESLNFEEAFVKIHSYAGLTGVIEVRESGEISRALTVVTWKNRARTELSYEE